MHRRPLLIILIGLTGLFAPPSSLVPAVADHRPVQELSDGRAPLVFDVRVFEARTSSPDYQTMDSLASIVDSDGSGVEPRAWLATLSRRVPDSFLGVLASGTLRIQDGQGVFSVSKRRQKWEARFALQDREAGPNGLAVTLDTRWFANGHLEKRVERLLEVPIGKTIFLSSRDMELSITEYISHFRDFKDLDERGELYDHLRNYNVFLVLAVTPRLETEADAQIETVAELPSEAVLPELESPFGVQLRGEVEFGFLVSRDGSPNRAEIVRSSIPEVNPRLLGALRTWRFPALAGKKATLSLTVETE